MAASATSGASGDIVLAPATPADRDAWDGFVARLPAGDQLQAWGWGEVAALGGERPVRLLARNAAGEVCGLVQVLVRDAAFGRRVLYAPHGPLWDANAPACDDVLACLLDGLRDLGRRERGIVVKLDPRATPDVPAEGLALALRRSGLRESRHDLQARTTRLIALGAADALLGSFDRDTRYMVRRSEREGVAVRVVRDAAPEAWASFAALLAETGQRAGIRVRSEAALARLAAEFVPRRGSYLALADLAGRPVAGCLARVVGRRAFYLYAGSLRDEALRHSYGPHAAFFGLCRALSEDGIETLDVWGVAEPDDPGADATWAGFSHFKRGFGGQPLRHPGTFDMIIDPFWARIREWRERRRS